MKVQVKGFGMIEFPDSMSEKEVKDVLEQFEPKKDDTTERLLSSIEDLLKKQKPAVVTNTVPVEVEKQVVITEPKVVEVEKEKPQEPVSWHFRIFRNDDDIITDVVAEPYEDA